jgi:hypothetical protein
MVCVKAKIMINGDGRIMVCGSHFRGNMQITPGGHGPRIRRAKELKLIAGHLASLRVAFCFRSTPRHRPETGSP